MGKNKSIIILIGPPGSGKTYWCNTQKIYDHYERISQDDHGQILHYQLFLDAISHSRSVIIIDRMNFSAKQRMNYVIPAKYLKYKIIYRVFNTDREKCVQKIKQRFKKEEHPTIKTEENMKSALDLYFSRFEPPNKIIEPFDQLLLPQGEGIVTK